MEVAVSLTVVQCLPGLLVLVAGWAKAALPRSSRSQPLEIISPGRGSDAPWFTSSCSCA